MRVTHYQNKTTTEISGDWRDWLDAAGYIRPPNFPDDSVPTLLLTQHKNKDAWAFYHPPIGHLDTEYICIGIPTEEEAENLLDIAVEIYQGPLSLLTAGSNFLSQEKYFA